MLARCALLLFATGLLLTACATWDADNPIDADSRDYLDRVSQLEALNKRVRIAFRNLLATRDRDVILKGIRKPSDEMDAILGTVRSLNPPPDLQPYHTTLVDAWLLQRSYYTGSEEYFTSGGSLDSLSRLYSGYRQREREAYTLFNIVAAEKGWPQHAIQTPDG